VQSATAGVGSYNREFRIRTSSVELVKYGASVVTTNSASSAEIQSVALHALELPRSPRSGICATLPGESVHVLVTKPIATYVHQITHLLPGRHSVCKFVQHSRTGRTDNHQLGIGYR